MTQGQAVVLPGPIIFDYVEVGSMETDSQLGEHLALDGQTMAVTMPDKHVVLIYQYDGLDWQLFSSFKIFENIDPFSFPYISSLAVANDLVLIGNTSDDDQVDDSGAVYIYEYIVDTWTQTATVKASSPEAFSQFGWQVAFDQGRLLVGSPSDDENGLNAGAVYVFTQQGNAWVQSQKLTASDINSGDTFGAAISSDAGRLLVGAPNHDYNAAETGAAYLYEFDGSEYVETQKILGAPSAANSDFGRAVTIEGDLMVVGAPDGFNDFFLRTGSAYVFRDDSVTWQFEDKVFAGSKDENFGRQVALHGEQLVAAGDSGVFAFHADNNQWLFDQWITEVPSSVAVDDGELFLGLPDSDNFFTNDGKVAVYTSNGNLWDFDTDLFGFESNEEEQFGYSIALAGDHMLASVLDDKVNYVRQSSVKVLSQQGEDWTVIDTLVPSDSQESLSFGTHLITSGDEAFIASADPGQPGAVYVFRRQIDQWSEVQKLSSPNAFADDGFGYEMSRVGDFLFVSQLKDPNTSFNQVDVFKFNGVTWDFLQTLSSGIQNDLFGYELVSTSGQLLVTIRNDALQQTGPILVYEEVSPDSWQWVETLPVPPGLPQDLFFSQVVAAGEWLVASHREFAEDPLSTEPEEFITLHAYQQDLGQWTYQFASEQIEYFNTGALFHELAFEDGVVLMVVAPGNPGIFSFNWFAYFFELDQTNLSLESRKNTRIETDLSISKRLFPVLHDQWAYVGFPGDIRNGLDAGSVVTYDLDVPELIFADGFDPIP